MHIPSVKEIRRRYIDFFVNNYAHKEISSASIIPDNDPTVLFTTAGMHPLVPYLMGEPHPSGSRLVNSQKCVRTDDIEEVGDATHCTFFEMLGNWSLGDYFKELAIEMSFKLLTTPWEEGGFGLPVERISVSCFEGDSDAPRDEESKNIWLSQKTKDGKGIPSERIYFLPKKKNWWGPAGQTGPCGPDTEMFYDVVNDADLTKHKEGGRASQPKCDVGCDCGRYVEVWNDVFMQYNKNPDGIFTPLKQQNVDTGLGLERMVSILQKKESPYETELFWDVIAKMQSASGKTYGENPVVTRSMRIIADHLRAATFIMGDSRGVTPSNKDQGYIVRRLIRIAVVERLNVGTAFSLSELAQIYIDLYKETFPELGDNSARILEEMDREEKLFEHTVDVGMKKFELDYAKSVEGGTGVFSGELIFELVTTIGLPFDIIRDAARAKGDLKLDEDGFKQLFEKHQELSRAGATQKFAGGLADHSEECKMHHTATHLVHQALRDVLGSHVSQKGSNITKERLRFDFNYDTKVTPEQLKQVEDIVNKQIDADLPIHFEIMEVDQARNMGAIGLFEDKYAQLGNKVKIYIMGDYSKEVCGGPHVEHTGVLKHFKILKEEACSRGIRRIKAVVEGIKDVA